MSVDDFDHRYMRRAIELSYIATNKGNFPFGAVIVKNGSVVAEGENRYWTDNDPTGCAEMVAMRNAGKMLKSPDLSGCVVYASCEPCAMCVGAMFFAKVSGVCYGIPRARANKYFDTSGQFEAISKPIDHRWIPAKNLCAHEAWKVMEEWAGQAATASREGQQKCT